MSFLPFAIVANSAINQLNSSIMFKKSIASIMMLIMVLGVSFDTDAQESKDYTMWQNVMITPDYTNLKVFGENMRKHNETYHKDGNFNATVFNISTGPNAGSIIWQMGPLMFKHNDSRPEGAHDIDWRDNVMPYVKKIHTVEYWSQDDELTNTNMISGKIETYPILFVRVMKIKDDGQYLMKDFFKKVSSTLKSMPGDNPWGLYYNEFIQGDIGRHVATVSFNKNWAEFDEDGPNFKEAFEKLHGNNSFQNFLDTRDNLFDDTYDEIWIYNKELSGD
ncbi:hypothetical protein [Formosa maritima]|uniref:NIPSNAP domain-containing protein n=1 Tax=Formosa maritima TaxID=2592046 RepID=A0A5D0G783_9FLAO|nr:hypothetical protein [Formosa maritima]TYA54798.1 hypothetical protein FVF61_08490 [Formosa maritima]